MITKEERDAIQARLDRITPAPWINPWNEDVPDEQSDRIIAQSREIVIGVGWHDCPRLYLNEENADFIVHTPEDIRKLLDALDEAECCMKALKQNYRMTLLEIRKKLNGLSYESGDWSHGEYPRVVELNNIDDLMDEFDEARFSTDGDGT